jgi:hypothetical protein
VVSRQPVKSKLGRFARLAAIPVAAATLATAAMTLAPHAFADSPATVSRGDAERILYTALQGCAAIEVHHGVVDPDPCNRSRAAINSFADGKHVCQDDWHVVRLGFGEGLLFGLTTRQEIFDVLDGIAITIDLDGQPLDLERSPNIRMNPTASEQQSLTDVAYFFYVGAIFAPEALVPGAHTLLTTITGSAPDIVLPVVISTTFYVDSSGTGACLT